MSLLLRTAILATLATACLPVAATAQSRSADSLLARIERLELRTAALEERIRQLEGTDNPEAARGKPAATRGNARDIANWRRLKRGMSFDEVRNLLGEPDRVSGGYMTLWSWERGGDVTFLNNKLEGWTEPQR